MVTRGFEFHLGRSAHTFLVVLPGNTPVMTANANKTETICECQYTSPLSSDGEDARTKDISVANMHEFDEDSETDEGTVVSVLQPRPSVTNKEKDIVVQDTENASEDESAYTGDSFCSDESCDESEVTNIMPGSPVNDPSSLSHTTPLQHSGKVKSADAEVSATLDSLELCLQNDKFDSMSDELPNPITMDRFVKLRRCKRWNMSFTDEEMRRIERENELLLRKIMAQQKPRHKVFEEHIVQSRTSSSAINRRKLQKKIDDDNMLLVRRIQQAKSCVLTNATKMSSRLNFL